MANVESIVNEALAGMPQQAPEGPLTQEVKDIEAKYDTPGRAFREGLVGSLLGPVADLGESEVSMQARLRRQEKQKLFSLAGTLAGYATGAATGLGMPGMITGAGRAATGAVARATGSGLLGSAVGTGLEGAGIALSEANLKSYIDLANDMPGAGAELARTAGSGAMFGGGLGIVGNLLPRGANWLFQKGFSKRIANTASAKSAHAAALDEFNAYSRELESLLSVKGKDWNQLRRVEELQGKIGGRVTGTRSGIEMREGVRHAIDKNGMPLFTKDGLPVMQDPLITQALKKVWSSDKQINRAMFKALDDTAEGAAYGIGSLATDAALFASGGPMAVLLRQHLAPSIRALQTRIFEGILHLKPIKTLMSASLQAGKITGSRMKYAGGAWSSMPTRYDAMFQGVPKAIGVLKAPPIKVMTEQDFRDVKEELESYDPMAAERGIRLAMAARGVPQEAATSIVEAQNRIVQYLQQQMPQTHPPKWIGDEGSQLVPDSKRQIFSIKYRAAMSPASVLSDFFEGRLSRAAAEAWWRTQPEMAQFFAERIKNMIDIAQAHGKKFSADEKYNYALLTDPTFQQTGRTRNYNLIQSMQQRYQLEQEQTPQAQPGGPPAPGSPKAVDGINNSFRSSQHALNQRLDKR